MLDRSRHVCICDECSPDPADVRQCQHEVERDRYREALERIYKRAYGASGVTGDDAGYLTELGMAAKEALGA